MDYKYSLRYFREGWKRRFTNKPLFVTFFITARCNMKCKHCFYWKEREKTQKSSELSLSKIELLSKNMPPFPQLQIIGGEPFLRDDLYDITKLFYHNNKTRFFLLPTNGYFSNRVYSLCEKFISEMPDAYLLLHLSIDGVGEEHDRIRGLKGSFIRLMQTYEKVSVLEKANNKLYVEFLTCCSSFNKSAIEKILSYLKGKYGVRTLCYNLVRATPLDKQAKDIRPEDYLDLVNKLHRNYKVKSIFERLYYLRRKSVSYLTYESLKRKRKFLPCFAGRLNIVISEEGIIYPCELLHSPMGDLRKEKFDFNKVWNSEKAKRVRDEVKRCSIKCTHETNVITNATFSFRAYFYLLYLLLRNYFKELISR